MERAAELFSASDDELGGFKASARAVDRMSGKIDHASRPCGDVRSNGPRRDCVVFNSLRMNLWVIRSRRENHCCAVGGLPSREMGPKELPSTLSRGVSPLVRGQLAALGHGQSPGRYPGSAQARRVSPTAPDLLSTGPVDNLLFRGAQAAYGCAR